METTSTPTLIPRDEWFDLLSSIGELIMVEQYKCPHTGEPVQRGIVVKRGVEYLYTIRGYKDHNNFVMAHAEDVLMCLVYAGKKHGGSDGTQAGEAASAHLERSHNG